MGLFWGIFGPQNVRAVLNRAIFNHWVSNLDCAHDFKISPPAKQKTPILGNLCRFWGNALFWVNFFPQFSFYLNSFYPNFFFTQFFFTQIFYYPNFFFQIFFGTFFFFWPNFFFHFFYFFPHLTTFHRWYVCCMLQHVQWTVFRRQQVGTLKHS